MADTKDPFLSAVEITDLASIEAAVKEVDDTFGHLAPWWRGHGVLDWPLRPGIFRPVNHADGTLRYYDEVFQMRHFMAGALARHPKCPDNDDTFSWLLLAQHYGLHTRVLDWSESVAVGLFFAVEFPSIHEKEDGCLWALHPGKANEALSLGPGLWPSDLPAVKIAAGGALTKEESKSPYKVLAVVPQHTDARMLMQHSTFTLHTTDHDLIDLAGSQPILRLSMG